jgi:ATP-binding cassette subfamily B protein
LDRATIEHTQALADALPFYGEGDAIPAHRDLQAKDDTSGVGAVMILMLRCWPYIAPQILGRWWVPGAGIEQRVAELISGRGYSFAYMPPLVTALALAGPYFELVPLHLEYPFNVFYGLVALMVICTWPLPFLSGRVQIISLVVLLLTSVLANLVAVVLIEGSVVSVYSGLVTAACLLGWMVQIRLDAAGLHYRVRVASHVMYYYALTMVRGMGYILLALVLAEVVNQSVLQNEPLMPGVADMIGYPNMSNEVTDSLTQAQRMDLRWAPIKFELALFVVLWPLNIVLLYYVIWIFQRINHALRLALVARWHRLSLRHHSEHRVGDSIWRINTDSEEVIGVLKTLSELSLTMVNAVTGLALLTILSPLIGFIALSVSVPSLLVSWWAMRRFRTRSLVSRIANADLTSRVQESFRSIRLSKAYQAGERTQQNFEADSVIAFNAQYRYTRLWWRVIAVTESYGSIFTFAGVFLMALWVNSGEPTYATELIALAGLSFVVWNLSAFQWTRDKHEETVGAMKGFMYVWADAQRVAMGLKRVFEILDMDPEVTDSEDALPFTGFTREIRFDDVTFAYSADRPVLNGASLTATPGTITAIVGPTGSGKSTLMSMLLRLFDPESGAVFIDGHDLREFEVDSLRKHIAIALQENVLFGMSVRDNIRYAVPDADENSILTAVRIACLEESVVALPEGLDTMLGDRGGRLSTGQRQRLSIARAVVRQTPIMVLDEPTAALDADTEHRVLDNLADWVKDPQETSRAIFLITHRISTIRRADNIVYLEGGRVVESGNHDTLMNIENGRYRAFVIAESKLSETSNV